MNRSRFVSECPTSKTPVQRVPDLICSRCLKKRSEAIGVEVCRCQWDTVKGPALIQADMAGTLISKGRLTPRNQSTTLPLDSAINAGEGCLGDGPPIDREVDLSCLEVPRRAQPPADPGVPVICPGCELRMMTPAFAIHQCQRE